MFNHTEDNHTAVHFTDTHPKAAKFWCVWQHWADFFHASGPKAARHEHKWARKLKHYNSLQCLPALQLLASSVLHSVMTQYLAAYCNSMKKENSLPFQSLAWEYCFLQAILQRFGRAVGHSIGLGFTSRAALRLSPPPPHLCSSVLYKHWRWRINQVLEEHGLQLFPPPSLRSL